MKTKDIAPCGINCSLCLAYQRDKNHCNGCNGSDDNKAYHCVECRIRNCEEKKGNKELLCSKCEKYPCARIKHLEKRYTNRYNVSVYRNFEEIKTLGIREFIKKEKAKWQCDKCGKYFCMHREKCLFCGNQNIIYIEKRNNLTPASTL